MSLTWCQVFPIWDFVWIWHVIVVKMKISIDIQALQFILFEMTSREFKCIKTFQFKELIIAHQIVQNIKSLNCNRQQRKYGSVAFSAIISSHWYDHVYLRLQDMSINLTQVQLLQSGFKWKTHFLLNLIISSLWIAIWKPFIIFFLK